MNKAEKILTMVIAIVFVCSGSFLSFQLGLQQKSSSVNPNPEGYLYLQTQTYHALEVWQDNETKVNDTTTVFDVWFLIYYNSTSNTFGMSIFKSERVSFNTSLVYQSFNTSQAIQWAIENNEGIVEFQPNTYNLTNTIIIDKSNTALFGASSKFVSMASPIFEVPLTSPPLQDIQISGFTLMLNGTGLEVSK